MKINIAKVYLIGNQSWLRKQYLNFWKESQTQLICIKLVYCICGI
jgi:hypothetical protein